MGGGEGSVVGSGNSGSSSNDSDLEGKVRLEEAKGGGCGGGGRSGLKGAEEKGSAPVVLDVMPERKGDDLKCEKKEGESNGFQCRICHLDSDLERAEGSELILLGCGCKGELGTAHRHCAEAWFKLRGNRYCEICGIIAKNITGTEDDSFIEDWNANRMMLNSVNRESERGCWKDQPFCKFLIVCLVVAFILPWFIRVSMF